MKRIRTLVIPALLCAGLPVASVIVHAATAPAKFQKVMLASATRNHAEFDQFVARAKTMGATHIDVTVELERSTNAKNVVSYQAQLDRVRRLEIKPDRNPVNLSETTWDRQLMLQTARNEIDTAIALQKLLLAATEPILHVAATAAQEEVTLLSPRITQHLKTKIDVMNAHWDDYGRIFTHPFTTWHDKY
jgi:hypothetical protein